MRCVQVEKRDTSEAAALTYVTDCLARRGKCVSTDIGTRSSTCDLVTDTFDKQAFCHTQRCIGQLLKSRDSMRYAAQLSLRSCERVLAEPGCRTMLLKIDHRSERKRKVAVLVQRNLATAIEDEAQA